jgi:ATP-dependent helicase HrpB
MDPPFARAYNGGMIRERLPSMPPSTRSARTWRGIGLPSSPRVPAPARRRAFPGDRRRRPVIVLQPRRVAVRAVARRIADEQGWTLGREVGWHIRFERRFAHETQVLVVTEGILTARLLQDPLLSAFTTIVFDEFHERSVHADVGLALARQAWLARDDLRLVVMSATLDDARVATFLGDCPVVTVAGMLHPLTTEHAPGEPVPEAVRNVLPRTGGHVLCFLPGARDQRRLRAGPTLASQDVDVLPLQVARTPTRRTRPSPGGTTTRDPRHEHRRKPRLTVPGVAVVIDTGR